MTDVLYHASAQHGIQIFTPRRCWFSPDWCKSGMLEEGDSLPLGMIEVFAFFAGTIDFVAYFFAPPRLKRFSIARSGRNFDLGSQLLGFKATTADRILVFEEKERDNIRNHTFSLYEFDAADFRRLPTEYIAERPVTPIRESVLSDAILQTESRGISVAFVNDIEQSYRTLSKAGVEFRLLSGVIAPLLEILEQTAGNEVSKLDENNLNAAFQEYFDKGKQLYSSAAPDFKIKATLADALQNFMHCIAVHQRIAEVKKSDLSQEAAREAVVLRDSCIELISLAH